MSGFYYLASPYTKYAHGQEAAFEHASANAALLTQHGIEVYSPITHTHPLYTASADLRRRDHAFWMKLDRPFMDAARGMIVLKLDGWTVSDGIQQERTIFRAAGKPIIYMTPYTVPEALLTQADFDRLAATPPVEEVRDVGGPTLQAVLPSSTDDRKAHPIVSGVLDYFPLAIAEVARISHRATQQHHPDKPMHWDRSKSTDHADCIGRHLIDRGTRDVDGERHTGKLAWRSLAMLQTELEEETGAPRSRASR